MVLYRKYRPQTLNELIGQVSVKQALNLAFTQGKLAHAYLFYGPRGSGKTSTARILAKMVNCEQSSDKKNLKTDSYPCNKCLTCLSITDGSHLDVIEMDAASNRGIEEIRALRETIKLAPSAAPKKVYIIDEVHMLTTDAFNALLKTLEEPPSHVLFILATTEVQKIPPTILSRVTRLDFQPATAEELVEALTKVAKTEKIQINEEALVAVAKHAQGSFRDGIKFLDLLSTAEEIDLNMVEKTINAGVFPNSCLLLEGIAQKDTAISLQVLTKEIGQGINLKELNLLILDILRQLLLIKYDLGEQLVKKEVGAEKFSTLQNLATKFTLEHLTYTIKCFTESLEKTRFISIPSLSLELAVVESSQNGRAELVVGSNGKNQKEETNQKVVIKEQPAIVTRKDQSLITYNPPSITNLGDIEKIQEKWTYILETVRQYNYSLEALLRLAKILECGQSGVVIEVPYSFHQRILEAPKSRDLLEGVLSEIVGRSLKISTVLGQRPINREELANVEIAADDEIIKIASEIFNSESN